jgi:hypothetical protein
VNREERQAALALFSRAFYGVREEGGNNRGPMVEKFQKAVDGIAQGEPWCMAFVQFCLKWVDELAARLGDGARTVLPPSELTTFVFNHAPVWARIDTPEEGAVVVWTKLDADGKPTLRGHCGIVSKVLPDAVLTIEGNTSAEWNADQRDGDGVFVRLRTRGEIPGFQRLGYLRPWL